ncbi:sirohydrochlorin chelatase [Amycolatopsis alkalitolerans]|uniref:Sirohydrochlorin chelatase n=1 Tax=Amycolatopsis alkalitolerans TaxID=2547244 RepID=A0A5C4LYC9_9PSEU|nr:sirohydrochlorin chelatase [Amycolatopsis alkalitolerans]TNC23182.1 sirohydrochlorin chelatase [Amycolatopsis alkalitolerans]
MIVLAAHGTRDPAGARVIEALAARVQGETGVPVRVAYADVRQPDVTTVLRCVPEPAVVIPAFLSPGYHVCTDIPAQIEASGHRDTVLTAAFGPAPELIEAARDRLHRAGYRRGDAVVLAAAGSGDPRALVEVRSAASALSAALRVPVRVGYAATARPSVADAVALARGRGRRVAVASWLLAPGLFQRRLDAAGADVVAEPLGAHPGVADLVLTRYRRAVRLVAA